MRVLTRAGSTPARPTEKEDVGPSRCFGNHLFNIFKWSREKGRRVLGAIHSPEVQWETVVGNLSLAAATSSFSQCPLSSVE